MWVSLSPILRARISALEVSMDPNKIADIKSGFVVGMGVQATVLQVWQQGCTLSWVMIFDSGLDTDTLCITYPKPYSTTLI